VKALGAVKKNFFLFCDDLARFGNSEYENFKKKLASFSIFGYHTGTY
jgi:hypothetical protein